MNTKKGYSRESIAYALAHHESRGALRTVSPPEPGGRSTWRVIVPQFALEPYDFTEPQAFALCVGLAAAEHHARVEHERFVHELAAYAADTEPPCLDDPSKLTVWGSECQRCNNATHASMTCDVCKSSSHTVELFMRRGLPPGTRCGLHGDSTESGRCDTCDLDSLHELTGKLDAARTIGEAEQPFEALCTLVERTHSQQVRHEAAEWANSSIGVE